MRSAKIERNTTETQISVEINLDGTGVYDVETGVGFFDHMLEQLSRHSLIDMTVRAKGSTSPFIPRFLVAAMVGLGLTEPIVHEATIYAVLLGIAIAAGRTPLARRESKHRVFHPESRVLIEEEQLAPLEAA